MSNVGRALLGLVLLGLAAACAPKPEPVYVQQPVTAEPVQTGKYK